MSPGRALPSTKPFVLASASPRRLELLKALGLRVTVDPSGIDETLNPGTSPEQEALRLAQAKAKEVRERWPRSAVLAADTLVVLDDRVLMKPADRNHAVQMLQALRGREHRVITGVSTGEANSYVETKVHMRPYSDAEIELYVATGDPMDKAGAYAIQHSGFRPVDRIDGCYCNVVGLPLGLVRDLLDLNVQRPAQCEGCPDWKS